MNTTSQIKLKSEWCPVFLGFLVLGYTRRSDYLSFSGFTSASVIWFICPKDFVYKSALLLEIKLERRCQFADNDCR